MKSRTFILVFLCLNVLKLYSQALEHDFPTMRWHNAHGLNSYSTTDVEVDSKGRIWVSNVDGLYLHNGDRLQNINTIIKNSPFENPVKVYEIYIDDEDRLWIGTFENGLMMYDINTAQLTHFDGVLNGSDQMGDLRVYGIHMLNDSTLRFCSHTHGLIDYHINKDSFELQVTFTDPVELERLDGFQLMIEPLWTKYHEPVKNWYASLTGMVEYDEKRDTFLYHFNEGDDVAIRKAMIDSDSVVWCVTYGQGLFSFNLKTKQYTNYRCQPGENWSHRCLTGESLTMYNDSILLLDSEDKSYFFNKRTKSFHRFNDVIPHCSWSGMTTEMKWIGEDLWLASWSSSLYRHFPEDHGVKSISATKYINEVYIDEKNERYISISPPELITFHEKDSYAEMRVPEDVLEQRNLEGVTFDHNGNMWFVTNRQVVLFDPQTNSYKRPFYTLLDDIKLDLTFRKIITHPNGTIWLTSHDGTIFTFDPKTLDYTFYGGSLEESVELDYQYRANLEEVSDDGYVWFSAQTGFFEISPYDDNHKFFKSTRNRQNDEPITMLSPAVAVDNEDQVYFGAKTDEIYVMHMDSIDGGYADLIELNIDLPTMSINDLRVDDYGNMWIATKYGLIQLEIESGEVYLFGDAHRLINLNEIELKDGKYPIVTTSNDFLIINPDELRPLPGKPNIQLVSVELDSKQIVNSYGQKLSVGDKISLGPDDNFLRLQFNDFNYVSQLPKSYAIKVEGVHDDWIDLNKRNEFGISGLPGGTSEIWVKSKLAFTKEYSNPTRLLTVNVTPPLIQRKSFWAFCLAILLLLIYWGYRYRLTQMNEKQNLIIAFNKRLAETEMKALRAQMNPHFLFNVLNAIKLNVQKNEQENAIDFITDFSKLIRSVLQNSGKKRITLGEELEALELYIKIERKRFSTSFDYTFEVDPSINLHAVDIPPMLLQPYVENAIWHGILHKTEGTGKINVTASQKENSIEIEVLDNGIGREKANKLKLKSAQKNKSMGMQITKDRMAISNKISSDHISVDIEDLYDEIGNSAGTRVVIKLQLEK